MGCFYSRSDRSMNWEEYLDDARTGDLILWSSSGTEAKLVRCMTNSYYSHVGIVLRLEKPLQDKDSGIYLYHSPSSPMRGVPDLFSTPPVPKDGPQLNDLRGILYKFRREKSIEVRRLMIDADVIHPWTMGKLASDDETISFAKSEHEKHYERNLPELFNAAYDGPGGENVENLSSYFCSELVAELLKRAKVLTTSLDSNEFTPANFSSDDDRKTPLQSGFSWEREIKLDFRQKRTTNTSSHVRLDEEDVPIVQSNAYPLVGRGTVISFGTS